MRVLIAAFVALAGAGAVSAREVIVGFKPEAGVALQMDSLDSMGLRFVEALPEISAIVAEADDWRPMRELEAMGAAAPGVEAVEENLILRWLEGEAASFQAAPLPPVSRFLEGLPKAGRPWPEPVLPPGVSRDELPWGIQRVNAPGAWPRTQGAGAKVAILDTGIDPSHPDIAGNYAGCADFVETKGACRDDDGHGTHVAGTIAGALDGKGVAGVAPRARLYAVKVLKGDGTGSLVAIIKGLLWCANNGMQVANMSLGAPIGTIFMRAAVKYAAWKGVTVVAAAGNDAGRVDCPACYPDAVAVSASDMSDKLADFSNRGSDVDFVAPGVYVKSSLPGGKFDWWSGTSMATPHVSGLAALAASLGARGPDAVRAKLTRAAKPIGLKPAEQGAGMIDASLIR